ncbi:MAG: hypothetical protein AAGB11_14030 [Pseudomonadota bacterium]
MRRIRIPGLLAIISLDHPLDIRAAADDARYDRPRAGRGPLLNRMIARRFERTLRTPSEPLPSARLRDDEVRVATNKALAKRFNDDPAAVLSSLEAEIEAAARYVAGIDEAEPAHLAQNLFGRLFVADFKATNETVAAAQKTAKSLTSANPLRGLVDRLTGQLNSARATLSAALGNDPSAVHAVSVAAANLAATLKAQRALFRSHGPSLNADAALTATIHAPKRVARQTDRLVEAPIGTLKAGTLILLETGDANAKGFDRRVAFLSEAWSACPASGTVIAITKAIWTRAGTPSETVPAPEPEPVSTEGKAHEEA